MTETEDPLLRAVAALAAEEDKDDKDEKDEKAAGPVPPLSAERREQITQAALRVVRASSPAGKRRRPLVVVAMLVAPLALAAGILVVVRSTARPLPLPRFALVVSGGNEPARGAPAAAAPLALLPDAPIEVVLRPPVAVTEVGLRAFVAGADGWSELAVAPAISPAGVLRLRERAATLFGDRRGAFVLHLLVGRPAILGEAERLVRLERAEGPGWQRLSVPIQLLP